MHSRSTTTFISLPESGGLLVLFQPFGIRHNHQTGISTESVNLAAACFPTKILRSSAVLHFLGFLRLRAAYPAIAASTYLCQLKVPFGHSHYILDSRTMTCRLPPERPGESSGFHAVIGRKQGYGAEFILTLLTLAAMPLIQRSESQSFPEFDIPAAKARYNLQAVVGF